MNRQTNAAAVTAWFSQVLQDPSLQQLDQLKTGVHFVQIVHSIDPTKFDLSRCDFRASSPYHYEKNFKLLQEAMDRMGIAISFVIERVMEGVKQNDLLRLASYFQLHFDAMRSASVRDKERGGTTVTSVHGVRTREKPKRNPDSLEAHQRVVKMVDPASPVVTGTAAGGGAGAAWSSPSEGPAASRSPPPVETAADEQPVDDGGSNSPSPSAAVVVTTKLSRAEELRLLQEQYNPVLERSQAIERRRRRMRPRVNQAALEAASVRTGTTSNVSSSTNRTTTSCSLSYVDGQLSVLYRNSKRCVPLLSSAAMEERNNAATAAVAGAATASSAVALPELVPLPGGVPLLGGADTPTGDQRITRWAMQVATSQAEQDGSFRGTSPTMSTSPTPDGTAAAGARRAASSSSLPNNNTPLQQQPYLAGSFPATTMADSESSSVLFGATPMTTAHATAQPYTARPGAHPLLNTHASSTAVGSGAAANVLEMFGDAMLSSAVVSASLVGFSPWNLVRVAAKQQLQQQRELGTTSVCPADNSNNDDAALGNRRHQECATTTETDASVLKTEFSVSGFTNTTNSATASMKSSNSIHCPSSPSLLLSENSPKTTKIKGTSIHDDCNKNDVQAYTQTLFRTVWAPSVIDVEGDRTAQQHYISYEEILAEKTKLLHQMVQRQLQLNHPSSVTSSHAKHPHSAAAHHASGGRRPSGGGLSPVPGGQGGPAPLLAPPPPLDRLLAAHPSHPNQNGPHIGQLHSDMSSGNLSPRSTATPGSAQQLSGTVFLSPMTRTHSALSMLYSREGTTSPLVLVPDATTSGSWGSATAAGVAAGGGAGGNGAAGGGNEGGGGVPLSALSWSWIDKETFRVDAWDDFDRAMGWLE